MSKRIVMVISLFMILVLALGFGCAASAPKPTPSPAPTPTPSPAPQKVIELRFSHHNPPTGRTTLVFLNPWAKQVEDATKGAVKITMYPAESLAKSMDNIEAIVGGIADMGWLNLGNWTGRFPLTEVKTLPFLCLNSGKLDGKTVSGGSINSRILQELYEKFPEIQAEYKEMKILFLHTSDPFTLFTTKKPVRNMADLSGMKVRAFGKSPTEMWKLLGASPVNMPMPDVYDAGQKGVIDGVGTAWAAGATYKFYEAFRYCHNFGTDTSAFAIAMNKDKWNSIPPDVQNAIMSVSGVKGAQFAGDTGWGVEVMKEYLAAAEKAGKPVELVDLDAGEYGKWQQTAGKPIWDKWLVEMKAKGVDGQKLLDAALELLKKYSP
jgi:TRAP-type C4-dicarboxylate transport system substrate-binding protein